MILVNYLKKVKCYKQKILEPMLILLSPFAPFICEEIWHKLKKPHTSISYSKFPIYDDSILTTDNTNYPIAINGKVKVFGIIKCFKSIKKIIIKKMLNIANSKEVIDIPNK